MAEVQTYSLYPVLFLVSVLFNLIFCSDITYLCDLCFSYFIIYIPISKNKGNTVNLIKPQNSHIKALPQAVMPLHTSRVNTVNCRFVPTILKNVMKFQTLA